MKIMNESSVADAMAEKLNISSEEGTDRLNAILDCITEELAKDGEVKLVNFGLFWVIHRSERTGFQPYYRRYIPIPAYKEPAFRPGKELREMINQIED